MASAARKRLLRQQANAANGRSTREYKWNPQNKWGGPPLKKDKKPKTKSQLQAQYDKDQNRIAELEKQVAEQKSELVVARTSSRLQDARISAPDALQQENRKLMEEVDKWKARCQAMKIVYQRRLNAAP